jgi:dTDP-4-dehydrorhamnose 3,5-epimerase-like enzyme
MAIRKHGSSSPVFMAILSGGGQLRHRFGELRKMAVICLSAKNRRQVLIPPKHGNGHLVLSEEAIFHYKQSTDYDPGGQFTYKWDDPALNIWWPINNPILSRRDESGHFV